MNRPVVHMACGLDWSDLANPWGVGAGGWSLGGHGHGKGCESLASGWRMPPETAYVAALAHLDVPRVTHQGTGVRN
jgi:hypothetical protein